MNICLLTDKPELTKIFNMVNKQQIFTLVNGRVSVKGIHVGLPIESAKKMLLEQSFTIDKEDVECLYLKVNNVSSTNSE